MRPNLNKNCDSKILTLFSGFIPSTVTLIAFDLIYSKFSEQSPTPCLGMVATLRAFIKKLQKSPHNLLKSSENSKSQTPSTHLFRSPTSYRHLRVR